MAEINISPKNKPGVAKAKKLSTRVDLTPMVDLGFLLITFFVFTTTMSKAKVMELNEPANGEPMPVTASGSMTILLGKANQIYYYDGILDASTVSSQLKVTDYRGIRDVIRNKRNVVKDGDKPASKLMYIIKADKEATYKNMVDILDEMLINGIYPGHYAEVDLTEVESVLMAGKESEN